MDWEQEWLTIGENDLEYKTDYLQMLFNCDNWKMTIFYLSTGDNTRSIKTF